MTASHLIEPNPAGSGYLRRMETRLTPLDGQICEAAARLEFHFPDGVECRIYELVMRIDEATRTIVDARVPVFFAENELCGTTVQLVTQLVGLNVLEKFTWRIHRIFGTSCGCQHLLELSEEIGRAWFNRMAASARIAARSNRGLDGFDLSLLGEHCAGLKLEAQKLMGIT